MEDRLATIFRKALQFRDARDWKQFHDPKNLAKFLWATTDKAYDMDNQKLEGIKEEIADIMIFLTYLCSGLNIDLVQAVESKIQVNAEKYPIEDAKSSSKKYSEFRK